MTPNWPLASLAALGSLTLLAGALFFQYVIGLAPCQLCVWQRYPHVAAVVLGILVWAVPTQLMIALGAVTVSISGVLGIYHTGVERRWWEGPSTCSGSGNVTGLTPAELLDQIMAAPVTRCTDVPWELLGLSMASWNAILSFGLAAVWLVALRRS